jgi:hypothetical protein
MPASAKVFAGITTRYDKLQIQNVETNIDARTTGGLAPVKTAYTQIANKVVIKIVLRHRGKNRSGKVSTNASMPTCNPEMANK